MTIHHDLLYNFSLKISHQTVDINYSTLSIIFPLRNKQGIETKVNLSPLLPIYQLLPPIHVPLLCISSALAIAKEKKTKD